MLEILSKNSELKMENVKEYIMKWMEDQNFIVQIIIKNSKKDVLD